MLRRLFHVSAALSLALGVLTSVVVGWACVRPDTRAKARNGIMYSVSRTGDGGVGFARTPWPRDEPLTVTIRGRTTISSPRISWNRDYVLVERYGWTGLIEPGSFDPWGDRALPGPTSVRMTMTYFKAWRIAGAFMVLPLAWAAWQFWPRRKTLRGFDVEPVGTSAQ